MKTLTIIIPVYNESHRIKATFKALDNFRAPKGIKVDEIVFVDDGSTDDTVSLIKSWNPKMKIVSYLPNRGRGFALRRALNQVNTDYALYLDGDMAVPLENIKKLVPLIKNNVDLVAGSKKKPGAICTEKVNILRTLIGLGHSLIAWLVLGMFYWDFQGGFKLFSKRLIDQVIPLTTIDRWGFDMEIIFLAEKLGYKCRELPVKWTGYGNESKVVLTRDIFAALKDMINIRFPAAPYESFRNLARI